MTKLIDFDKDKTQEAKQKAYEQALEITNMHQDELDRWCSKGTKEEYQVACQHLVPAIIKWSLTVQEIKKEVLQ